MELSAEKINGTHTHTHCRHIEIVILLQYFNADRKAANDSKNSKSNHNNNGPSISIVNWYDNDRAIFTINFTLVFQNLTLGYHLVFIYID